MVSHWDWRDRHGQNWITSVKNQASCGSCWAFAATGATEALTNLFFNQHLNLNLSEQDVLSCSGAGSCSGGYPSIALNYITSTGVVDEATFPYTATDQPCSNKGDNPSQLIKIGGKIDFGSSQYPRTEDDLKRMIIERGPLSGGLYDWSHAMVLPGYMVVEEGDVFYYRNLNLQTYWKTVGAGDPLIGKTVWIFKNSWGSGWGDDGYVYVETTIGNFGWTHALLTPVQSLVQTYGVQCVDNDGDEYYWWGLGDKPSTCDCPDQPDGDDSDPTLGPLDQYGNCAILGGPPVANFTGNPTDIMEGQSVTFTDLSINNPTSWLWSFPGGVPLESTEQHPVVVYPAIGTYDVTLTVANDEGSDVMTITGYIHVTEYVITYCSSSGTSTAREWIQTVNMDSFTNNSGSDGGYGDYTGSSISVESGQSVPVTLTPGFSVNSRREFWRIWIDFNIDGDFTDPGEQVFAADNTKNTVTGSISIPSDVSGETRMRVSMKNNAAPTSCEQFSNGEVEDYTLVFGTPGPQPPVADFSGTPTTVSVGNSVQFTDLSENNPTSWSWTFDGGTPATSTDPDPTVTYNTEGTYDVMLTVTNAMGSDTKIITGYIIVIAGSTYCSSQSSSNDLDWIAQVQIGDDFTYASEASLYSDFTGQTVDLTPGSAYNITLTPYFTGQDQHEFWRVWIDYNGDGDFEDSGETVFSANNKKTVVTGTISIPTTTPDQTRMRITMKNGSSPSPCETFPNGEVEDYTASFISGPASLGNEDHFDLTIYPNPATSMLYIHLISNTEAVKIKVYNSLGGIMDEFDVKGMTMQIDLGNYPDGLYYLGAERGKEILFKRFVKN
jgi:PKD repeat protein